MTEHITVGEDGFTLPIVELLTGRGFITGKSGSGKSNSASVVAEQLLDEGFPLLCVDTDGEYWGLKEEYEILHVGADEECDLRVGPEHAEKLASLALEDNVPIILDVSGFLDEDEGSALIREVAKSLFAKEKKLKKPFLMLVEEIHEYVPEGGGLGETGQMLVKIGKRGRKHGLGIAGISQRPADVKKDFITQCDWLVWNRLTWNNDTNTAKRVLGSDEFDGVSIEDLGDGEAFVMADWENEIRRVQWQRKKTFDAGATPGLDDFERPDLKSVSGDLVNELEEISEREDRRQDRISQLEQVVKEKDAEIAELQDELAQARQMEDMAQQFTEAITSVEGNGGTLEAEVAEIREEKDDQIRDLERELDAAREELDSIQEENGRLREELEDARRELDARPELSDRGREAVEVLYEELGGGDESKWKRKYEQAQERIAALEDEADTSSVTSPDEYDEFVEDEYVQDAIEDAKSDATPRYVKGVVAGILQHGGPASRRKIADDLGIETTTHIREAMKALEERNVVTREGSGDSEQADFAFDEVEQVHERQARQRRTEKVMEEI